ncbi:hypothetical protein DPSP01_010059 [Paraphaeosphaeria sporulosa]
MQSSLMVTKHTHEMIKKTAVWVRPRNANCLVLDACDVGLIPFLSERIRASPLDTNDISNAEKSQHHDLILDAGVNNKKFGKLHLDPARSLCLLPKTAFILLGSTNAISREPR